MGRGGYRNIGMLCALVINFRTMREESYRYGCLHARRGTLAKTENLGRIELLIDSLHWALR